MEATDAGFPLRRRARAVRANDQPASAPSFARTAPSAVLAMRRADGVCAMRRAARGAYLPRLQRTCQQGGAACARPPARTDDRRLPRALASRLLRPRLRRARAARAWRPFAPERRSYRAGRRKKARRKPRLGLSKGALEVTIKPTKKARRGARLSGPKKQIQKIERGDRCERGISGRPTKGLPLEDRNEKMGLKPQPNAVRQNPCCHRLRRAARPGASGRPLEEASANLRRFCARLDRSRRATWSRRDKRCSGGLVRCAGFCGNILSASR